MTEAEADALLDSFYNNPNVERAAQEVMDPCHSEKTAREDGGFGHARHIKDEVVARERTPFR